MINEAFKERMKRLLGEEYEEFISALTDGDAVKGMRVNTVKTTPQDFLSKSDFPLSPLAYVNEGFILEGSDTVGKSAEHHSGMIYMQDPGAMATLGALEIESGWRVLDTCSAPGGKSTQANSLYRFLRACSLEIFVDCVAFIATTTSS